MLTIDEQHLRSEFRNFFELKPDQEPYDFQIRVAQNLLQGKSVVLQAPTGAGKTNTALFPYLYARKHMQATEFPRKLIYSVERRILVNNFHTEVEKLLCNSGSKLKATVLTGERPEDRELRGDMIFTTIDQTLSSFLFNPYSLSSRVANLNAGAVASSYLVFDEAHLFDPKTALPTLMWMLKTLKGVVPTLLMTATFSKPVLEELAQITGGVVVSVEKDELAKIPAQATKKRYFQTVVTPLTAEAVLKTHKSRSIVVCNTVDRAQRLYDELETHKDPATRLLMLHARFWQSDRKEKEQELLRLFGPRNNTAEVDTSGSAILVATQVIEVGVDITCEDLHTELAPANTILQRAGRCARHPNETGTVHLYQVENELPYKDDKELFEPTFQTIAAFNAAGDIPVTFEMEQALIQAVHAQKDEATLNAIKTNRHIHAGKIEETINFLKPDHLRDLIRDTDSRSILVHPNPGDMETPFAYETFSVFDGSFRGKLKWLWEQAEGLGLDWVVKWPEPLTNTDDREQIERRPTQYRWNLLKPGDNANWQPLVVINPRLISYDKERGFRFQLNESDLCQSKLVERPAKEYGGYDYRLETYAEHIRNVNWAYGHFKFEDEIAFAVSRLQDGLGSGLPVGQINKAIRLSFVFHDAGKLTQGWQTVVHNWQKEIGKSPSTPNLMLAHTDYDWRSHREIQREFQSRGNRRPPHAVEGATIVARFLYQELRDLQRPVVSAIARHHSPLATELSEYKLHRAATNALNEALAVIKSEQVWNIPPRALLEATPIGRKQLPDELIVRASSQLHLLVYMLIIRVLRLADQNSFEYDKIHSLQEKV